MTVLSTGPGGDRLTKTDEDGNITSYAYDAGHELAGITTVDASRVTSKSTVFTYDANGNQTGKTVTPPSSVSPNTPTVTNRVFDAEDNMVGYGDKTFVYDSADHKVEEADPTNGVTAQNVYEWRLAVCSLCDHEWSAERTSRGDD